MQYILSFIFASLLVAAQSSWKVAVNAKSSPFNEKTALGVGSIISFIFSPLVLLGGVVYALATGLYMYMLSKYDFSLVQSLAVPLSLVISIFVAVMFFGEHLSAVNYLGLALIVTGIVLITTR